MGEVEQIAKELVVAWLSGHRVNVNTPEQVGELIGKVYTTVLQAVKDGATRSTQSKV